MSGVPFLGSDRLLGRTAGPPAGGPTHCRRFTAHRPETGVALPTAPRQWGSALHELHCLLPAGSEALHCRSCRAHCP